MLNLSKKQITRLNTIKICIRTFKILYQKKINLIRTKCSQQNDSTIFHQFNFMLQPFILQLWWIEFPPYHAQFDCKLLAIVIYGK